MPVFFSMEQMELNCVSLSMLTKILLNAHLCFFSFFIRYFFLKPQILSRKYEKQKLILLICLLTV